MKKNKFYFLHAEWGIYTYLKNNNNIYHIHIHNDKSIDFLDLSSTPIHYIFLHRTSIDQMDINNLFLFENNKIKINYNHRLIIKEKLFKTLNVIIKLNVFT